MNEQALEYWLDGNDMDYEPFKWGYVVEEDRLPTDFVKEIGACGGSLQISTNAEFLIVDPEYSNN